MKTLLTKRVLFNLLKPEKVSK